MKDDQDPLPGEDSVAHAERNTINVYAGGTFIHQAGRDQSVSLDLDRPDERADQDGLSKSRQAFLFDFYRQALKQAGTTFRLSVIFMTIGATVVIAGGILALTRFDVVGRGNVTLLTALSGVIIGSCGGAFAVHAGRARKHLTEQAEKMEREFQDDRRLEQTLRLIDEVENPVLRDRLKSVTAMRVLDLRPDPESVTQRLLAVNEEPRPQIPSTE
ncbi:hypothetical protein AB0G02_28955 [Actinosynnema sp. NPDC023658]|uniref:TRADD-N-associated membrane domain-containing protein n=1 Tax=Actinosynnema sp. NPDC023658 TaxID=3155465 RepID=UPI0033F67AA0